MPDSVRGFVRDVRLRWACEEAGLPYTVRIVALGDRATSHLDRQPFGQIPFLDDGGLQLFEGGAALIHLARKSDALMPADPQGIAETLEWTVAALNSMEMVTVPWWFLKMSGDADNKLVGWMSQRLAHIERVPSERDWLAAGRFTVWRTS
ncbi:MAG: glutathione S-transferase [Sphingomonas bacterium]|nr:glutathione S-transferase [Sphingomonas bacterium]